MNELIELVDRFLEARSYLSKSTLVSYKSTLNRYCREKDEFTSEKISSWLSTLKSTRSNQPAANKTKQIYAKVLKVFAGYLMNKKVISVDDHSSIAQVLLHFNRINIVSNRRALTTDEVAKIYAACNTMLDNILIWCAFRLGCRVSEISVLLINNFNLEDDQPYVDIPGSKGRSDSKKYRKVPLKPIDVETVQVWLKSRKDNSKYFVVGPRQHGLSVRSIQRYLSKIKKRGDVDYNWDNHESRYFFGINLENYGMPLSIISKLLGHSNIATTSIYLQRGEKRMLEEAAAIIPDNY